MEKGDFVISLPTDYLGINIYTGKFERTLYGLRIETFPVMGLI
jgi:hypothetical protein